MPDVEVLMPKADPNMTEGRIIEWLKKPGDRVKVAEALANVETEKLEFAVEATVGGVLKKIFVQAGDKAEVAKLIAIIETS